LVKLTHTWLGRFLLIAVILGAASGGSDDDLRRTIQNTVRWVSEVGVLAGYAYSGDAYTKGVSELTTRANKLEETAPAKRGQRELDSALMMYVLEVKLLVGDTAGFAKLKEETVATAVLGPEVLALENMFSVVILRYSAPERGQVRNELGTVLPVSSWGSGLDSVKAPELGFVDPPLADVSYTRGMPYRLEKVADLYGDAGLKREEVNSLLESIYSAPVPIHRPESTGLWMRIAKLEESMGERLLAVRGYLSAAHNDPARESEVVDALVRILAKEWKARKEVDVRKGSLSLEAALKVADLYRQSNLHPMALRVLAGFDLEPEGPEAKVRDEIAQEWAGIVRRHRLIRGPKCVILGQKVDEVKDWAAVKIPRPSDLFWKPQSGTTTKPAGGN
jgi:hypothetical protein